MSTNERTGQAVALSDLVNGGLQGEDKAPVAKELKPVEPAPVARSTRPGRKAVASPSPQGGRWAGPVPRTKVDREPLNANVPQELDLLRRLRRYSADSGVGIQDYVAAVLHAALNDAGYGIDGQDR